MEPIKLIKPSYIDTSKHFFNAFDNAQREVSANWVVRFCQVCNNDSWQDFALSNLQAFYEEALPNQKFHFNGLDMINLSINRPTYGVIVDCDRVIIHNRFVAACYQAAWKY